MTSGHVHVTCVYVMCHLMTSLQAVDVVPRPSLDSFDELVRQLMDCRRVPGIVVTAVDLRPGPSDDGAPPDPVVVQRQYGWADIDARRPMKSNTRVCIASLTKAFTSTLLGIMLPKTIRHVLTITSWIYIPVVTATGSLPSPDCECLRESNRVNKRRYVRISVELDR